MKFYKCNICGNVIEVVINGGGPLNCCGEPMEELTPKVVEELKEKHLPVVTKDGTSYLVKVGSIEHPMTESHYIQFITIYYNNKSQRALLKPNEKPEAVFKIEEDFETMEVYEYCNIHGLWKTEYRK